MLKKISICGFKCFDDFSMDELKPVTVVGGSNNVGKSALLEGIYMQYIAGNLGTLWDLINMRSGNVAHPLSSYQAWAPFFSNMGMASEFTIKTERTDNTTSLLRISKVFDTGIRNQMNHSVLSIDHDDNFGIPFSSVHMSFECGKYRISGNCVIRHDPLQSNRIQFMPEESGDIDPQQFSQLHRKIFFYRGGIYNPYIPELISKISLQSEKKKHLIQILQQFDEHIVDIATVLDGGFSYVYAILDSGKSMPINYMGDGINRALQIVVHILSLPNGILLLDEIENGFYYQMYDDLAKAFFLAAKMMKCQIILTTHSRDMIESVLKVMEEMGCLNELCYQRIDASHKAQKRLARIFQGENLKNAFEANMEVR